MTAPGDEYARRLAEAEAALADGRRRDDRIVAARAVVLVAAAVVLWLVWGRAALSPMWLALPAVAFVGLVVVHDRVLRAKAAAERRAAHHRTGLDRLAGRWIGVGANGAGFAVADHPYVADLDCFGDGSLFQLLCAARTVDGERTLADWLSAPAAPDEIAARQTAVAELRPQVGLREALALAGDDVRAALDTAWLARWGAAADAAPSWGMRLGVALVPLVLLASIAVGPKAVVAALLLHGATGFAFRGRTAALVASIERPARELRTLAHLLAVVESTACTAPRLRRIADALSVEGRPPSAQIARLHRLVTLLDARRNQMFIPFAGVLLWTTQLGLALAAWRAACGPAIGRWLAATGELEALSSLARHAYEHPADVTPVLESAGPCFDAAGLAHPLLPPARAVRNDLRLDAARRLLVVSGSNMSGKSTLLRTVGCNVVLALAGGTVRAERLRLSPLAVGASIRVADSLLDGRSRFYAEILRLRAVVEQAGAGPTLFLLDEILHGTNSHDRRIGAEAVVRALLDRGAIGLVTTHDLALTALADALAPGAANVHFEDQLDGDRLRFDYRMRPGVVTRSNALALMRAVGIEV